MHEVLRLEDLSCERDERLLFSELSASYNQGDIVQIAGPNGAGKTTLLRILCGITGHYEGNVVWFGSSARDYKFHSSLLYFGHQPAVKSSLTALENLSWYFGLNGFKLEDDKGGDDENQFLEQMQMGLSQVGLAGYEDVMCSNMSAGQKRRVGLARLYISSAPVWILDEPFTAIDRNGVVSLEKRIKQHAKSGGIVILTTHQALNIPSVKILDIGQFKGGDR